jgi:transposase
MSKTFGAWDGDQVWLLPPSVHDFVPAGHPAHLVRELVRTELDLAAIVAEYEREERGQPPDHPAMMVALLLYAYTQGSYASRRIARAREERLDVMAVTGLQRPDLRTISAFRRRHLEALAELFTQVLRLCRKAGLAKLGHVALDGTKIQANASKHAEARRLALALPVAQADGRAGDRSDQARPRLPPVPAARLHQGRGRMGARLHRPQPRQARHRSDRPGRLTRLATKHGCSHHAPHYFPALIATSTLPPPHFPDRLLTVAGVVARRSAIGRFLVAAGLARKKGRRTPPSRTARCRRRASPGAAHADHRRPDSSPF